MKSLPRTLSVPVTALAADAASAPFARTASAPPTADPLADEYDIVLAQALPLSLAFVFETLWRDPQFTIDCLAFLKETNIVVSPWQTEPPVVYTAFERPETFMAERRVSFTHNKKNFIGPGSIPTVQVHRYSYIEGQSLIVSTTSTVSDAPYCDYFRAEARWVFTHQDAAHCYIESGVRLKWTKSTWLKGQIESLAKAESAQIMQFWVRKALEAHEKLHPTESRELPAPPATPPRMTPERTLQLMRLANVACLGLFLAVMLQFAISVQAMRSATLETVRLQKEQHALLAQPWVVQTISHWPTSAERHYVYHALRRLGEEAAAVNPSAPKQEGLASGYGGYGGGAFGPGGNLNPFGGASAEARAVDSAAVRNEAHSLNTANAGTSAEKKADQSDIFYEKLIIFKKSHNHVKEQAKMDQNQLAKSSALQTAEQLKLAQQGQVIS
ncbi:hypothetical protein ACHHYP_01078 [Achlya hypogyna]|uniref:VASt domain-containing protein n=1 Tax=Achlya hypogyna TaxID=1202772 RepID=A0A1V9ZTR3_ACHHY|nr:hypothetical protein ACHHYP_01078 [Achlya hypogyna]